MSLVARSTHERNILVLWRAAGLALSALFLASALACGGGSSDGSKPGGSAAAAPTITSQPQDRSVVVGQTATFRVVASGTAPLSYQWKKSGNAISGATSDSYATSATTSTDNGATFSVTVTNSTGHADSNSATLTVTTVAAVSVVISPTSASVASGGTQQFTATVTGSSNTSVTWSVQESGGGTVSTSGLYTAPSSPGTYHVTATSVADNSKSAAAEVTVGATTSAWDPHFMVRNDGADYWISVDVDTDASQVWLKWSGTWYSMSQQSWSDTNGQLVFAYSADIPDGTTLALKALSTGGRIAQTQPFTFRYATSTTPTLGVSVSISPITASIDAGTTQQFTPTVTGTTNTSVTWTVQESGGGSVSSSGLYTAPSTPGTYHVVATSLADTTMSASAKIIVKPTAPPSISSLKVVKTDGCSATLSWTTGWPCNASVSYQKSGGTTMTRGLTDFVTDRTFVMDLLEPSTTYSVLVTATDAFGGVSAAQSINATTTTGGAPDVTITIDPSTTTTISPYIYGLNFSDGITDAPAGITMDRQGGNRWTAYNWENNASNAGSDWYYDNDDYLGGGDTPAGAVFNQITSDQSRSQASLMTVQLQGYVAADKLGTATDSNRGDLATRFKQVVNKKGSAFTTTPSTADAFVYMDEFLWNLDHGKPGIFGASAAIPTFVNLDNEPELWNSTHSEIQGTTAVTSDDYITKTISLTKALKDQFPNVKLFGAVHYGFLGAYNWNGEMGASVNGSDWFVDKYLLAMKVASNTYGKRLVDVYDFHWYSEATSTDTGQRVAGLTGASLTDGEVQAIVQCPRSLWDPTYSENSWISNDMGIGPIMMLARLQSKIDAEWPGTQMAITEYESGGDNHIAGAVAQADNLGIFADKGVFAASWWPPSGTYPYTVGAFRAYRGFDGANANFGDTSLKTTSSSIANVSVHASLDSQAAGRVVFVAINRSTSFQEVALNGQTLSGTATVHRITAESGAAQVAAGTPVAPVLAGSVPVSGNSFLIVLPPMSVSTIEVK